MFTVRIEPDAKAFLQATLQQSGWVRPGVMIYREGTKADVTRTAEGGTQWNIDRASSPWALYTGSFETYPDNELIDVDGIRVHLSLLPRPSEKGVVIRLRHGELVVENDGA